MPVQIRIGVGTISIAGELLDTACARTIAGALPVEAALHEWGDEFYCTIPVAFPPDATATTTIRVGDIGYWPPGNALAIFFGPTPMSSGDTPVPASGVNLVGRITGNARDLKKAKGAKTIRIERM